VLALVATAPAPALARNELIVRFERGTPAAERTDARTDAGVSFEKPLPLAGMQLVSVDPGRSPDASEARLDRDPRVAYAEPNLTRAATQIPNDTYFTREWGLHNSGQSILGVSGTIDSDIDAPEAWDLTTGNSVVTVAVIDSGVDASHPDLAPNVWSNPGESGAGKETNGVDDDGDGMIDDVHGWDWVGGDANPSDANGHGTHVAGTIGARGNDGLGVAGVSWSTGLMPLRVLDSSGNGSLANVISAYGYAAAHGARVVNASFGGAGFSHAEYDAIHAAAGTLFVAAAGNDAANNDAGGDYPCSYDLPNLVCVAATDQQDALASFSNYGAATVDLGAPGTRIASDQPGNSFAYMSGTSMATPHVSGSAALVFAERPGASVGAVRQAILAGADPDSALTGKTVTGGRLNVRGALDVIDGRTPLSSPTESPPPPAATPATGSPARVSLRVPRGQSVRRVIRRGLRMKVGCSASCRVGIRTLRRGPGGSPRMAGRRHVTFRAAGKRWVRVHLGRRAKRALRRGRRVRLTVVATPFGVEGASVTRRLRLARR
jgi:subtilisin family serine protease